MKMKIVCFGDAHLRETTPVSRLDDIEETIEKKINEIKEIAREEDAVAILTLGDLFDSPKVSDTFLTKVKRMLGNINIGHLVRDIVSGKLKEKEVYNQLSKYIPLITVRGNHDLFGNSNKNYEKTSLFQLEEAGVVSLVTKENPLILTDKKTGFKVAISGSNYHTNIDKQPNREDYILEKKSADLDILLVHGYGTNQDFGTLFSHTNVNTLGETVADLTIIGHDHIGFDPVTINGKTFVNPGSIIRLSNDLKEIKRRPKVMIIEIDDDDKVSLRFRELTTALDASLVLDRTKTDAKKEEKEKMKEIGTIIDNATSQSKSESIVDIVKDVAETTMVNDELLISDKLTKELMSRFSDKMVKMPEAKKAPPQYYIIKLILINFQSHVNTEILFSKGLNVLTGESRSGKTSILRAMKWIFENSQQNARSFIHMNEEFASAEIHLSNGYIIKRKVEAKRGGFNGYEIFYPDTNTWEALNTKSLEMVQELLGYSQLAIDSEKVMPINFLNQGSSWFFIGDGTTATERAKAIGTMFNIHYADSVLRDLEYDLKQLAASEKIQIDDVEKFRVKSACIDYLPEMIKNIDNGKAAIHEIEKKVNTLEKLKRMNSERTHTESIITDLVKVCNDLENVEQAILINANIISVEKNLKRLLRLINKKKMLANAEKFVVNIVSDLAKAEQAQVKSHEISIKHATLVNLRERKRKRNLIIEKGKSVRIIVDELENIPNAIEISKKLVNDVLRLKKLEVAKQRRIHFKNMESEVLKITIDLSDVNSVKPVIQEIQVRLDSKKAIKKWQIKINGENDAIDKAIKVIIDSNKKTVNVKRHYLNLMKDIHECPLCLQKMDEDVVIAIAKRKFTLEENKNGK